MIVWVASFPRSGNTFLRILLKQIYGLPTYSGFLSGDDLSLDLRRANRLYLSARARLSISGKTVAAEVVDLSLSGCRAVVREPVVLRVGDSVELKGLRLDGAEVDLVAEIRWSDEPLGDGSTTEIGMIFSNVSADGLDAVRRFVASMEATNPTGHARLPLRIEGDVKAGDTERTLESLRKFHDNPEIFFIKTHQPHRLLPNDFPAIVLVRDGRDVLVSVAHYILNVQLTLARCLKMVRTRPQQLLSPLFLAMCLRSFACTMSKLFGLQRSMFLRIADRMSKSDRWAKFAPGWMERANAKTVVIKFEDLIASPVPTVAKAIAELGLDVRPNGGQAPSFEQLKQLHPRFFRAGRVGTWKDELPEPVLNEFVRHNGDALRRFGYLAT